MEHISFPSINQYRQVVKNIRSRADYHGVPYPKVKYEVTVKIHGSNAGICRPVNGSAGDIYFQSRERLITIESDNAGFAAFGEGNRELLNNYIDKIVEEAGVTAGVVQIFGEWFGGNIQKGVGVNGLDKMLCIFGVRISDSAESREWASKDLIRKVFGTLQSSIVRIYTKYDFPHWEVEVDFDRPELSQNRFVELCNMVEKDCPVARFFKPDAAEELIGEGVVIVPIIEEGTPDFVKGNTAKIKGEKHSVSKVKTTATLDPEKMTSHREFVEKTLTENRMRQGVDKMRELGHPMDITSTGLYVRWILNDIIKEESDTMVASLIEPKDISKEISIKARNFWFNVVQGSWDINNSLKGVLCLF
jgi:hypothetical protein